MTLLRNNSLLRRWQGPLTEKVRLAKGKFGLGKVPQCAQPDSVTDMVCGFCSTGCSLRVHSMGGKAVNLSPNKNYPVNLGMACPKGWEALTPLHSKDRATVPLLRNTETGKLENTSWDSAIRAFCERMKGVQETHGVESVAFLSTGQIPLEEMAMLGMVAKFGMGVRHGDGNTRQCMATAVTAYKESFGFDAPPYSYSDFEESDVLVFVGANPCIAHPILWQRVLKNKRNPEIVVIDPRCTETAMAATHHVPISPKSDLPFFYSIAQVLVKEKLLDDEFIQLHTDQFEEFAEFLSDYSPEKVSSACGIDAIEIKKLARLIGSGKRVSFWWTMGVNQSHEGTRTAQAIINLALMTGNIGKPGTGANSITGQCNAMGSRLFSNTTSLLGGHDFRNPAHRDKVADLLNINPQRIPSEPSWDYDRIIKGVENGEIKALWIIATNPSHSWIDQNRFNNLLNKLDFLVVQDMYNNTETALNADLILPAAAWGEKSGTLINSERRLSTIKAVSSPPGQALSDFEIFQRIASYWEDNSPFVNYDSPEALFKVLTKITQDQPCDITGVPDYAFLDTHGGVQWPCKSREDAGIQERRLFEDREFYTNSKRAQFVFEHSRSVPELPCSEYPLILLTGRGTSAQWHTQTRTGKSAILRKLYPQECYVEINAEDASFSGIANGDLVRVASRRGELRGRAVLTTTLQSGQVFIPMHYEETNQLTLSCVDPYSRQPSYKYCAVTVNAV